MMPQIEALENTTTANTTQNQIQENINEIKKSMTKKFQKEKKKIKDYFKNKYQLLPSTQEPPPFNQIVLEPLKNDIIYEEDLFFNYDTLNNDFMYYHTNNHF